MNVLKHGVASLLVGCWLMSCSSSGQPNETVKQAFTTKFGTVSSVSWTQNADYSFAHFTQNGKPVVVVFGNDGQLIATEPAKPIDQ